MITRNGYGWPSRPRRPRMPRPRSWPTRSSRSGRPRSWRGSPGRSPAATAARRGCTRAGPPPPRKKRPRGRPRSTCWGRSTTRPGMGRARSRPPGTLMPWPVGAAWTRLSARRRRHRCRSGTIQVRRRQLQLPTPPKPIRWPIETKNFTGDTKTQCTWYLSERRRGIPMHRRRRPCLRR